MLLPTATPLELMLAAPDDPIIVLMICQQRLIEARDLARINFDAYAAAEIVRETTVILSKVADALKQHSLSPPFPRPSRKQINAAVKAFDKDAEGSPAWQAI